MVKSLIITLLATCASMAVQAADWAVVQPQFNPSLYVKSYSGVLLNGHSHHSDSFDLWLVNSGYQYPVVDDVTLFMEAGPAVADQNRTSGFNMSSGVRYQLSPAFNIGSQIKHPARAQLQPAADTQTLPHRQLRRQRHHCRSGAEPGGRFQLLNQISGVALTTTPLRSA